MGERDLMCVCWRFPPLATTTTTTTNKRHATLDTDTHKLSLKTLSRRHRNTDTRNARTHDRVCVQILDRERDEVERRKNGPCWLFGGRTTTGLNFGPYPTQQTRRRRRGRKRERERKREAAAAASTWLLNVKKERNSLKKSRRRRRRKKKSKAKRRRGSFWIENSAGYIPLPPFSVLSLSLYLVPFFLFFFFNPHSLIEKGSLLFAAAGGKDTTHTHTRTLTKVEEDEEEIERLDCGGGGGGRPSYRQQQLHSLTIKTRKIFIKETQRSPFVARDPL